MQPMATDGHQWPPTDGHQWPLTDDQPVSVNSVDDNSEAEAKRGPRRRATTVYDQHELVFSDGRRRITPNLIRPVDKSKFNVTEINISNRTWFRVNRVHYVSSDLYKYSSKTIEELVDYNKDIKPVIKTEVKFKLENDFKLKEEPKNNSYFRYNIKTELKVEPKFEMKPKIETEIINDMTTGLMTAYLGPVVNQTGPDLTAIMGHTLPRASIQLSPLKREVDNNNNSDSSEQPGARKRRLSTNSSYECYFQSPKSSPMASDDDCPDDIGSEFAPEDNFIDTFSDPPSVRSLLSTSSSETITSTETILYDPEDLLRQQMIRSSMSRFDDNLRTKLFSSIISMLSMKEKLRLECVCKEWQRILQRQQTCLTLYHKKALLCEDWNTLSFNPIQAMNLIGVKLIEKFPNLTNIRVLCPSAMTNINPIVASINDNQTKLEAVMFRGRISTEVMSRFALLFGPQLKSIDINSGDVILSNPVLKEKRLYGDNLVSAAVHTRVDALVLNHLPSLRELSDLKIQGLSDLKLLANFYSQQITKLSYREENYLYGPAIGKAIKILSRFTNLEYLEFYIAGPSKQFGSGRIPSGSPTIVDTKLKTLANNCTKLKELHLFGSNAWVSLQRIHSLVDLKVLGLYFDLNEEQQLNYSQLKALHLTELWMYCDITEEEMTDLLSQMPSLTTLHIKSNYFFASQIHNLIRHDCNVRTFFVEEINIDEQTIGAAIIKARNHTKVHFKLLTALYEPYLEQRELCAALVRPDIPKNLTVVVSKTNPLLTKR